MFERNRVLVTCQSVVAVLLSLGTYCHAQQDSGIQWEHGPVIGKLGGIAQMKVPEGYRFSGKAGAEKILELTKNPTNGNELGVLIPEVKEETGFWFVIFEFGDIGYVKDDEKDKLDADGILAGIRKGTEASNKIRQQKGWPAFHVTGWSRPPFYNPRTNNLTWAVRGYSEQARQQQEEAVNYSVRTLGRRGTMNIDPVLAPPLVDKVGPEFESLMDGFSFQPGHTYAEFRAGDKIAAYGLTAL